MDREAFFTVHRDLPREGPGMPEDVHWALAQTGLLGGVSVCDAGCGPGADLVTLADALPEAILTGIDGHPNFVAQTAAATARFGTRVTVREGDMAAPGGPYDLIWCAGALYFLGVTEGLSSWRSALKPGGWVAFSEPVLLGPRDRAVEAFWADYPAITDLAGIEGRVTAAGFAVVATRPVVGAAWAAYYEPLRARIAVLRAVPHAPALGAMLDECAREIALWEAAADRIAYMLVLAQPA